MANKKHDKEFKDSLAKLYLEEGRTVESISKGYSVSRSTITDWVKAYKEECALDDEKISPSVYEENRRLKKLAAELAIETLTEALKAHKPKRGLILHSDQGSEVRQEEVA